MRNVEKISPGMKPTLILVEHKNPLLMLPVILDINHCLRGKMRVVTDSALVRVLNLFGVKTIGVDTSRNPNKSLNKSEGLKLGVLPFLSRISGENRRFGLKGKEIVDGMFSTLEEGESVFLSPTGTSNKEAKWLHGLGYLVKSLYEAGLEDEVAMDFLHFERGIGKYRLHCYNTLSACLSENGLSETQEIPVLVGGLQRAFIKARR